MQQRLRLRLQRQIHPMKPLSTITALLSPPAIPAILAILALCSLPAGCDSRREIFGDAGVWVRLEVSWRNAGLRPQGVSIYVFARETGKTVALRLTNDMRSDSATIDSLKLHVGAYNVLVINETVASHDNASFRGVERYHDFEAYIRTRPPGESGQELIAPPLPYDPVASQNVLAAAHTGNLEVTCDMLDGKRERPAILLEPKKLSCVVEVTLHVKNLRYLHDGEPVVAVTNLAEGAFAATDAPNGVPMTQRFPLHARSFYQGSFVDGTITGTFVSFGVANPEEKNTLRLPFVLHDGTDFYLERDVTDKLRQNVVANGYLKIELGLGTPGDPPIVIDRVPVDDGDGMFEVEVDEWGENTIVDVPVG